MTSEAVIVPALGHNDRSANDVPNLDEFVRDLKVGHALRVSSHIAEVTNVPGVHVVNRAAVSSISSKIFFVQYFCFLFN